MALRNSASKSPFETSTGTLIASGLARRVSVLTFSSNPVSSGSTGTLISAPPAPEVAVFISARIFSAIAAVSADAWSRTLTTISMTEAT